MDGFHLLNLHPNLFERVITKIESENYFRLQQTCHEMDERIRSSRNISVRVDAKFDLFFRGSKIYFLYPNWNAVRRVRSFYGARIKELNLDFHSQITSGIFDRLCATLKNNRITCDAFNAETAKLTLEQGAELMKILKPTKISIGSGSSQIYEPLFQSKTLEQVQMVLPDTDIESVLPRLLSVFRTVAVHVIDLLSNNGPRYDLLRKVQQIVYTQPCPSLRRFFFKVIWNGGQDPTIEELQQQLPDCRLILDPDQETPQNNLRCLCVELPQHFPQESSFSIAVFHSGITQAFIEYRSRYSDA